MKTNEMKTKDSRNMIEVWGDSAGFYAETTIEAMQMYAIVDSAYKCFSLYRFPKDGELKYMPEDMILSVDYENLKANHAEWLPLYSEMVAKLCDEIGIEWESYKPPLKDDAKRIYDKLNKITEFVKENIESLDFCDLPIGHELLLHTFDLVGIVNETVNHLEELE